MAGAAAHPTRSGHRVRDPRGQTSAGRSKCRQAQGISWGELRRDTLQTAGAVVQAEAGGGDLSEKTASQSGRPLQAACQVQPAQCRWHREHEVTGGGDAKCVHGWAAGTPLISWMARHPPAPHIQRCRKAIRGLLSPSTPPPPPSTTHRGQAVTDRATTKLPGVFERAGAGRWGRNEHPVTRRTAHSTQQHVAQSQGASGAPKSMPWSTSAPN